MATALSITRTSSIDTDRITSDFDSDFITCPICCNVLWKPVACQTCENSFCLKCIRLWLKEKPNVCPFNCKFQERKPPAILLKILSKVHLECRFKENGCTSPIPYEAIEKHELEECLYKIVQCPGCSNEMLKKEFDEHEDECRSSKQITCMKCSLVYNSNEQHSQSDCLQTQIILIKEKVDSAEQKPKRVEEKLNRLIQLHERFKSNDDNQENIQSNADEIVSEPLRISTIIFNEIPRAVANGGHIPNGYAGFNWENAYYMFEAYSKQFFQVGGFRNAFTDSRDCVAYNGRGKGMSFYLPNQSNTFGLHSFQAMSIYHKEFELIITSFRLERLVDTRRIALTSTKLTMFEIDWDRIDKIVFEPKRIYETAKPETFALTCLNLIL